jgi:hypothetical protein
VAADVGEVAVAEQPVEEGCEDHRIARDLSPLGTALVAGEGEAFALLPEGDEGEQRGGSTRS